MLRSVGAVVAGYLLIAAAIIILFAVAYPDPTAIPGRGFMLFSLVYGFLFGTLGGWVCGLIARGAEIKHAAVIAGIGILLTLLSMLFAPGREPMWYQLANMAVLTAAVLLGGWLRTRQRVKNAGVAQPPAGTNG
ncbi:MAG TPA: hypothetical protein VNL73_03815 [Verrucomicrobiae bacterium]|nr:hypothetical protein [Verrucomicrobiae bacterium]